MVIEAQLVFPKDQKIEKNKELLKGEPQAGDERPELPSFAEIDNLNPRTQELHTEAREAALADAQVEKDLSGSDVISGHLPFGNPAEIPGHFPEVSEGTDQLAAKLEVVHSGLSAITHPQTSHIE